MRAKLFLMSHHTDTRLAWERELDLVLRFDKKPGVPFITRPIHADSPLRHKKIQNLKIFDLRPHTAASQQNMLRR
jgi:hypothetical protein